jgi:nucleoside-diphosphate-sugar epimerase
MGQTISILGCGWLGLPLGELLKNKGHKIKGSTTKTEKIKTLQDAGIEPFMIKIDPNIEGENIGRFFDSEILIINIPPRIRLNKTDAHIEQIKSLIEPIRQSKVKQIIYVSSTSVYPELNREVFEEDIKTPESSGSPILVTAEKILQDNFENVVVLRCGGLMGYDRIPAKYFAGWKGLTTGYTPVNYIHRDDVIMIIDKILSESLKSGVFNTVSPIHPTRKEIYEKICETMPFEKAEFVEPTEPQPFKIINSDKLIKTLGYEFIFANPLDYTYQAVAVS